MALSKEDVRHIAQLARLALSEEEAADYAAKLSRILDLVDQLRQVDTQGVVPMAQPLDMAQRLRPDVVTKSSVMLGLGESDREVEQTMDDLREFGVDVVTFGQYLRPTLKHLPVREHVTPARFQALEQRALRKGFLEIGRAHV